MTESRDGQDRLGSPLVIIFARKYEKEMGIGSLVSVMLPNALSFAAISTLMPIVWILPGPSAPMYYSPS